MTCVDMQASTCFWAMFLLPRGWEWLPNKLLRLGAHDSSPPWFLEAAIRPPIKLDDVEAFWKLPLVSGRVVDPTIGVVLDNHRR